MPDLLFLSQRIPFPPNKGDKIRSFHVLNHLSRSWRVHLGCFIDDPEDWKHADAVRALCADVHLVGLAPLRARLRCLRGLVTGAALNLPYFPDYGLAGWVGRVLAERRPAAAYVFSSAMAQYLLDPRMSGLRPRRMVMDFGDVDSDKWRQYAESRRQPWRWLYGREARRLLDFDRAVARAADASVFVSPPEVALFRRLAPESAAKLHDIGNGVDVAYFSPEHILPRPYGAGGPVLAFTGAMDYWPNIDAVTWFAQSILPLVRQRHPGAIFAVVGSNPSPPVCRLADLPGVVVTGRVADVRPFLAHADVAVVPMRLARGVQNKVLEAMAMARPVVCTPQALEGIEARPGSHLLVAGDTPDFAKAVLTLLADPGAATLGQAGRALVVGAYGWAGRLSLYDRLLGG